MEKITDILFMIYVIGSIIIPIAAVCALVYAVVRYVRKDARKAIVITESVFLLFYGFFFLYFVFGVFGSEYYEQVSDVSGRYTAFARAHLVTPFVWFLLFFVSAFAVWSEGRKLPPLILTLCVVFLLIGIGISGAMVGHLSENYMSCEWRGVIRARGFHFAAIYPAMNIIIAIVLIVRVVRQEVDASATRSYQNKFLNGLNNFVARRPVGWAFVLFLPVFVIITLILTLFGQESDSIVRVFTETTTWRYSQKTHPPLLAHTGHYLCTVAACGSPKVVKPVRLGRRHGREIIVNRQLMIANAFEEMISDFSPAFHRFVRGVYDRYGYPFSRHINTRRRSDAVYVLMKPLEWFFVVCLYLFCVKPEEKIGRQYL